jgi:hypothetical protein
MKISSAIIIIFLIVVNSPVSFAQTANPTRPSAADNGYLTEYGYSELEIGYSGEQNTYTVPALLKFTFDKKLEAGFLMDGVVNYNGSETKIGNSGIQLKYQFTKNDYVAAALVGKVEFSSSSSSVYTGYLVPSIQTDFAQIDITAGTSFIKIIQDYKTQYFYAFCVSPKVNLPFGFYGEFYGQSLSGISQNYFDVGFGYSVNPDFVLDTAFAIGLNKDAADWIFQIGFTKTLFKFL